MRPPSPRRRSVGRVPHYARAASRLRDTRRTRASRHRSRRVASRTAWPTSRGARRLRSHA